jgi:hypothetical protein
LACLVVIVHLAAVRALWRCLSSKVLQSNMLQQMLVTAAHAVARRAVDEAVVLRCAMNAV